MMKYCFKFAFFVQLRFGSWFDKLLVAVGILFGCLGGSITLLQIAILGHQMDIIMGNENDIEFSSVNDTQQNVTNMRLLW